MRKLSRRQSWQRSVVALAAIALSLILADVRANAADVTQTKMAGIYRVELHVLPAEPFFTKQEVSEKHVMEGMEIEGGAAPVPPAAGSHPNHHLVVHIFDAKTGKVVADATVTMSFVSLDAKGSPTGTPAEVPVVVMQAVGKGPPSTHYGNNVTMPPGRYRVAISVNDHKATFTVTATDTPGAPMGHMKM